MIHENVGVPVSSQKAFDSRHCRIGSSLPLLSSRPPLPPSPHPTPIPRRCFSAEEPNQHRAPVIDRGPREKWSTSCACTDFAPREIPKNAASAEGGGGGGRVS